MAESCENGLHFYSSLFDLTNYFLLIYVNSGINPKSVYLISDIRYDILKLGKYPLRKGMTKMLKIMIADDDEIIRVRLVKKIDWKSMGFEVIGEAADGEELLKKTLKYKPDVVLTDIKMPFMSGIEYVEAIRQNQLHTQVVIITGYAEFEYVHRLLHLGVCGYILKPLDKEELRDCMCRLRDKILQERELNALVRQDKAGGANNNAGYVVSDKIRQTLVDKVLEGKAVEVLTLIEACHTDMCVNHVSLDKMKQHYTYLCNSIYRALREHDKVDDEIKGLMLTLFEDRFSELGDGKELLEFIRALMERLLGSLHRMEKEEENVHLQKSLDYINRHFAQNISMAEVANHIGVSYGYLSYILNESVDGGFVRILRNRRMKEAKKLLVSSELKIYDIAEQCGFTNSRYFCTMFYADMGMTPTEYRKKNYKGNGK